MTEHEPYEVAPGVYLVSTSVHRLPRALGWWQLVARFQRWRALREMAQWSVAPGECGGRYTSAFPPEK